MQECACRTESQEVTSLGMAGENWALVLVAWHHSRTGCRRRPQESRLLLGGSVAADGSEGMVANRRKRYDGVWPQLMQVVVALLCELWSGSVTRISSIII
eukprot:scaffold4179_cov173-Cylindrotheca_fusiformis.AAC.1